MHYLKESWQFIRCLFKRYQDDGCKHSAAALTYMTLFALVPLMTVMYAMLSAIPASQQLGDQVQQFIFSNFVPTTGQEIQGYLSSFSQKARKLTGVGIIFLTFTAIFMLKNIESTFNAIWRTRDNRKGLSSFLLYWAILSLGPLFIGLGLAISTYLVSLKLMFDQVDIIGIGPHLLRITPYLLTSAAFTLIFAAIPNCRVPLKHAMIGGLVTGFAFEMAKLLFTTVVSNSSYQQVYGTFATIPLFLLWIYLSWLIVLAGAELVHAIGSINSHNDKNYSDTVLALGILELLWRYHQKGELLKEHHLLQKPWLFDRYTISADRWAKLRDQLLTADLLRTINNSDFVLGRDLSNFTLWDLALIMGRYPKHSVDDENSPPWFEQCQQYLDEVETLNKKTLSISLTELFKLQKTADGVSE
jgi:membrane protein